MEINKKEKIIKALALIISIMITLGTIIVFGKYLLRFIMVPLNLLSNEILREMSLYIVKEILVIIANIILILFLFKILYLYIYYFLKQIVNKKIIKGILLLIPVIAILVLLLYVKSNVHYLLRNSILLISYIVALICVPIIILGRNILKETKHKKIKIIILILLIIFIYTVNFESVIHYAEVVVQNISGTSFKELFTEEKEEVLDLSYLNNYAQVMARDGYLDKYDVTQILSIVDSKSMKIFINYKDSSKNIDLNLTNKEDEEIAKLKDSLESNFYKFNYEVNKENQITVNIERYVLEDKPENAEKNSEIILKGNKDLNLIKKVNSKVDYENYNYIFENEMAGEKEISGGEIYSLNFLLVYDKEDENFVPVQIGETNYALIESYIVNSRGIEITLKPGISLKKEDYTLRINRYNENLEILKEKGTNYYYKYEPVVDILTNSKNSTVLEIDFDQTYKLEDFKNIEIIF